MPIIHNSSARPIFSSWQLPLSESKRRLWLDPAGEGQDHDDQQNQAEAAAGVVAPAGTVRPSRQRADQQKNENDD